MANIYMYYWFNFKKYNREVFKSRKSEKIQIGRGVLIFVINELGGSAVVVQRGYSPAMLGVKILVPMTVPVLCKKHW